MRRSATAFAAGGRRAAAGHPLRRRPPPLGVHARRAPRELADALLAGAREAVERIDVMAAGCTGARRVTRRASPRRRARRRARRLSRPSARGAACAEALVLADRIGEELAVPVFLYGELAATARSHPGGAAPRRGRRAWRERMARRASCSAGLRPATACTRAPARRWSRARPPLVAFNLSSPPPATVDDARRDRRPDPRGRRRGPARACARSAWCSAGAVAQVSMNVERPFEVPLATCVEAVRAACPRRERRAGRARARARRSAGFPAGRPAARASTPRAT